MLRGELKCLINLGVKILGLVDNMSYFIGDDGKKYKIFGEGGVKKTAEEFQKEFLGEIPINPEVGKTGDEGKANCRGSALSMKFQKYI